ncbi:MAG TPA: hypothetical protein VNH11_08640 [Pirellulales bacterium]|nr:hypothetical protein [Pirellulales bacterium]HVA46427.1 hypothetical protein [Pirellulales bacterium]
MTQSPQSPELPNDDSRFDLAGAAAITRIREYRPNAGQHERSLAELLKWAADRGVEVPDFAKVEVDEEFQPARNGVAVDAKYCGFQGAIPDELIYWSSRTNCHRSIVDQVFGAVIINLAPGVVLNDERFLHILAHEVFELAALKKLFDESGGYMTAERLYALTEPLSTVKNLHWHAWEQADYVLERLREAGK